ncbi:hypothetical protein [Vibrio parahaemolyticus]|uniref:hypothetical protein n=1 Tax=Vibrio parahaemolyticus TaxID=670 RepID=UPI00235EED68|nr:hypothetical protein [Vibrio parahaemolyticus]
MNKKLIISTSLVTALLASPGAFSNNGTTNARYLEGSETPQVQSNVVFSWAIGAIIDAAESAIKGKIKSALKDAIFGSGRTNYVTLSQESLAEIENIVNAGFDNHVHSEMIQNLRSLEANLNVYSDGLQVDYRDESLTPFLLTQSNDLLNEPAFEEARPYYGNLTIQYSLAASLSYAIYADRVHYGEMPVNALENHGNAIADRLEARGMAAKNNVNTKVHITSKSSSNCTIMRAICYDFQLHDELEGRTYNYPYSLYGNQGYFLASKQLQSLRDNYYKTVLGEDYEVIVSKLRTKY